VIPSNLDNIAAPAELTNDEWKRLRWYYRQQTEFNTKIFARDDFVDHNLISKKLVITGTWGTLKITQACYELFEVLMSDKMVSFPVKSLSERFAQYLKSRRLLVWDKPYLPVPGRVTSACRPSLFSLNQSQNIDTLEPTIYFVTDQHNHGHTIGHLKRGLEDFKQIAKYIFVVTEQDAFKMRSMPYGVGVLELDDRRQWNQRREAIEYKTSLNGQHYLEMINSYLKNSQRRVG